MCLKYSITEPQKKTYGYWKKKITVVNNFRSYEGSFFFFSCEIKEMSCSSIYSYIHFTKQGELGQSAGSRFLEIVSALNWFLISFLCWNSLHFYQFCLHFTLKLLTYILIHLKSSFAHDASGSSLGLFLLTIFSFYL